MIAPTQPPANGPRTPTSGTLISKQRRPALNPNRIQHKTQEIATRSIRMNQGVTNKGGRTCIITDSAANTAAPAIFTAGLSKRVTAASLRGSVI